MCVGLGAGYHLQENTLKHTCLNTNQNAPWMLYSINEHVAITAKTFEFLVNTL